MPQLVSSHPFYSLSFYADFIWGFPAAGRYGGSEVESQGGPRQSRWRSGRPAAISSHENSYDGNPRPVASDLRRETAGISWVGQGTRTGQGHSSPAATDLSRETAGISERGHDTCKKEKTNSINSHNIVTCFLVIGEHALLYYGSVLHYGFFLCAC